MLLIQSVDEFIKDQALLKVEAVYRLGHLGKKNIVT